MNDAADTFDEYHYRTEFGQPTEPCCPRSRPCELHATVATNDVVAEARAHIARLKADMRGVDTGCTNSYDTSLLGSLCAEIERLRAENAELQLRIEGIFVGGKYADKHANLVWKVVSANALNGTVHAQNGPHIREFPWWDFVRDFTLLESKG